MVVIVSNVKLNPSGLYLALVQVLIIATTKTGVAEPKRGPLLYSIVLITISKAGRQAGPAVEPQGGHYPAAAVGPTHAQQALRLSEQRP